MKKIFKALAISAASVAMVAGIATATACSGGYNGVYEGSYHYTNEYGATYGMRVEVTVENNIITKVKDITNLDLDKQGGIAKKWDATVNANVYELKDSGVTWTTVSEGWSKYFLKSPWVLYTAEEAGTTGSGLYYKETDKTSGTVTYHEWDGKTVVPIEKTKGGYGWTDSNEKTWNDHISWLLQQYEGWSVADVLDISVYTKYGYSVNSEDATKLVIDNNVTGEPYGKDYNGALASSNLLITGSTQGSGRLILAIQDALK